MKNLGVIIVSALLFSVLVTAVVSETNQVYEGILSSAGFEKTTNPVNETKVIGFVCGNAACTSVDSRLWPGVLDTGADNSIVLQYPTNLQSQNGYAVYFYKEGYIPFEVLTNWSGSGNAGNFNNYPAKVDICTADIDDFDVIRDGDKFTASGNVFSPILHSGVLDYVPSEIEDNYQVDVVVRFEVWKGTNLVYNDSMNVEIDFSDYEDIEFAWDAEANGTYLIKLYTETVDGKCLQSGQWIEEKTIIVDDIVDTIPYVAFISPVNTTYIFSLITINIVTSEDVVDVFWTKNGGVNNISYSVPESIPFTDGLYTLVAYARDAAGNVNQSSVSFSVDTSGNQTIACSYNSDCGTNGFFGDKTCSGDDIYQDYRTFSCNNPGTNQSYCSSSEDSRFVKTCDNGCKDGKCESGGSKKKKPVNETYVCEGDSCTLNLPYEYNEYRLGDYNITTSYLGDSSADSGVKIPVITIIISLLILVLLFLLLIILIARR